MPTPRLPTPRAPLALCIGLSALLGGCDQIQGLIGGGGAEAAKAAEAQLVGGALPAAADAWEQAALDHPTDVDAASGAAYGHLLQGNYEAADAALAQAQEAAGERQGEVRMRRALVALRAGNLEAVKEHALASGLPAGKLLAGEVALADGERDEGAALLKEARGAGGAVGAAASGYLDLLEDAEPMVALLSEAQALWSLGERKVAVKSADDLVRNLPEERADKPAQLLLWAGRAASVREVDVAQGILDAMLFPPDGQAWRKIATQGIIHCAAGRADDCVRLLTQLEGSAPEDGLADARATAAFLIAKVDGDAARKLAGPYVSNAAARALYEAGDISAARESAPEGILSTYLGAGG